MYSNHKASRSVSRRVVLGTAAGAGVVGAGAALGITQFAGNGSETSNTNPTAEAAANAGTSAIAADMADGSPVVLYLEGKDGPMRIFAGAEEWPVDNRELANLVWQASQQK